MKKAIAILLGFVLALSVLAGCSGTTEPPTTEPQTVSVVNPENGEPEPVITEPPTETSEDSDVVTSTTEPPTSEAITTTDDVTTTGTETTTTKPDGPSVKTKAEAIQVYAAAVDKALKEKRKMTKTNVMKINRPLDGDDDIKKLLKINIAGFGVEKVVCGLMGEDFNGSWSNGAAEDLQPSYLTESDVTGFTAVNDAKGNLVLTINIKNCTNPNKPKWNQGNSPLGNITWDFTNIQSVDAGVKDAENTVPGLKITIEKKTVTYTNIQVKATIDPKGNFIALTHSYRYTARVENVSVKEAFITLGGGAWGQGIGTGLITYTF